jgi:predicted nucleotidyltransferase component of viral defense system
MARTYASPEAFKHALEQRLRASTKSGADLVRRRQLLVFDRFLARIVHSLGNAVILKGGLVLELRLEQARTTKDIDLRMMGSSKGVLQKLQMAVRHNAADFMTYEISSDPNHSEIQNDGMKYDGQRFRAECKIAGKLYGHPFGVDVAFGDPIFGNAETIVGEDVLAFANIAPTSVQVYPIETHIAEKLHAYTMPRRTPNSRIKDLPDMVLLGTIKKLDAVNLRSALEQTFAFRNTHRLPLFVPQPIDSWTNPYAALAKENHLPWLNLDEVTKAAQLFLSPVLREKIKASWIPKSWLWKTK